MMTHANPLMTGSPRQTGMSLIELMVALTISMLLLTGLVTLVSNSNRNFQELARTSQQQENGRYAWQLLRDELRLAGFYGELFAVPEPGATVPDPCSAAVSGQRDGLPFPVQGYTAATAPGCVDALTNTDVLAVRRAATFAEEPVDTGKFYIQSTPNAVALATGLGTWDASAPAAPFNLTWMPTTPPAIRPYLVHIYYISPFSLNAGDGIPTLKRVEVSAGATTVVPLVEGVENMQFIYGVDDSGDGNPDAYTATPADWSDVVTIQIHLLVRNLEPTMGYTDNKTYDLAGTSIGPLNDAYKRHVYTASVRLSNPAGRRE